MKKQWCKARLDIIMIIIIIITVIIMIIIIYCSKVDVLYSHMPLLWSHVSVHLNTKQLTLCFSLILILIIHMQQHCILLQ